MFKYLKFYVLKCFYRFNEPSVEGNPPSYPLCSVELKAFMWAAVDTPTCLRRGRLNMLLNPQPCIYIYTTYSRIIFNY